MRISDVFKRLSKEQSLPHGVRWQLLMGAQRGHYSLRADVPGQYIVTRDDSGGVVLTERIRRGAAGFDFSVIDDVSSNLHFFEHAWRQLRHATKEYVAAEREKSRQEFDEHQDDYEPIDRRILEMENRQKQDEAFRITPAALLALSSGDMANFAAAATPGGIEAQEAAGQRELCANSTLPKECPRADLEKLGFQFGEDADDLFVNVTMPTGWSKRAFGDHAMWSDLLDDRGRKRGAIFYKAAFYDRRAFLRLESRYSISRYDACAPNGTPVTAEAAAHAGHYRMAIMDNGAAIHVVGVRARDDYDLSKEHESEARAWLRQRFPNWEDPTAYWD